MQDTSFDNFTAAERLIAAHDGDVALLYIYSRHTGSRDIEKAAGALCRTLQELNAAKEKLQRMGLWEGEPSPVPTAPLAPVYVPPADELPQYSSQEIARYAASSPGFEDIRLAATALKGKQLNANELGILVGIGDYLSLPAEVVLELLQYCGEKAEAQRPGSRPGFRMIQQEAFRWANLEILTFEQAEAYIQRQRERSSALGRVQALLNLQDRALTKRERENIEAWLGMGFADDAIQLAFERTVYNTGALKWPYMDAILKSWHEAGLHDKKAVEAKERTRSGARKPTGRPAKAPDPVDISKLEEFLNKM